MKYYRDSEFVNVVEMALIDYDELQETINNLSVKNSELEKEIELYKEVICKKCVKEMLVRSGILKRYPTFKEFSNAYKSKHIEDKDLSNFYTSMSWFDEEYLLKWVKGFYARKDFETN